MEWLQENWFWLLVFVAFVAMHMFGHGGHGGGHDHSRPRARRKDAGDTKPPAGHQH